MSASSRNSGGKDASSRASSKLSTRSGSRELATLRSTTRAPQQSPLKMKTREIMRDPRYAKYADATMEELRRFKQKEIDEMNFDEGEFIEGVIRSRAIDNTNEVIDAEINWIEENVRAAQQDYMRRMEEINREFKEREMTIRKDEKVTFDKIKERHVTEIEELLTAREVQLLADENSSHGPVIQMRSQAKVLARADDFDGARLLVKRADETQRKLCQERMNETKIKYDRELNHLLGAQENQLSVLQERLRAAIEENEVHRINALKDLEKSHVIALKSFFPKAFAEGIKNVHTKEHKDKFVKEFNEKYVRKVKELEEELKEDTGVSIKFLFTGDRFSDANKSVIRKGV